VYKVSTVYTEVSTEERAVPLRAYSRLGKILADRKMSVADLGRRLGRRGARLNPKTLYRLSDPTVPIERLDMAVAGEVCEVLQVDLSELVSFEAARPSLERLTVSQQRRLDALLERQSQGALGDRERRELAHLVDEAERLTLRNAKLLARARHATALRS